MNLEKAAEEIRRLKLQQEAIEKKMGSGDASMIFKFLELGKKIEKLRVMIIKQAKPKRVAR